MAQSLNFPAFPQAFVSSVASLMAAPPELTERQGSVGRNFLCMLRRHGTANYKRNPAGSKAFNHPIQGREKNMARADAKTAVLADGLRYKSKVSGSPFAATTSFGAATMSCFMCGKHRARSLMGTRKVLGKSQAVCAPSCKALDEALENAAAAAAADKL